MVLTLPLILCVMGELSRSPAACLPSGPAADMSVCPAASGMSSEPATLTEEPDWRFQGSPSEVHIDLSRKII